MPNCLVIGQGTLPVQCAKILVEHGVEVRAVSSPDAPLAKWAVDGNIAHFGKLADFTAFARSEPFDYLFSVVNYRIIPAALLALPKAMSINYHDSPLPRYAGVRATTWALQNGERSHGITWHVMEKGIDTGDILKQDVFPIDPTDTVYKLNLKCYYTAIAAFRELVEELTTGLLTRARQDFRQRTYFALSKRPPNDCLVSFRWTAEQLDCFCRSLDFQGTSNVIGRPKIIVGGRLLTIPNLKLTGTRSKAIPGTVVGIERESVHVSTSTEDVFIPFIHTLGGRPLPMSELAKYGLAIGASVEADSLAEANQEPT